MIENQASNPGAIVIDGHGRGDLGVVRALGDRGVPVYLFTDDRHSPVAWSRFVTQVFPYPAASAGTEARVEALIRAGRQFRHKPVFFSSGDTSLLLFSRHRQQLEPYYHHHLSTPELVEDIYDKVRFAELASARRLNVPFTLAPRDRAELELSLPRFRFPVIVKPAEKLHWNQPELYALAAGNIKGVRFDTPRALLEFYDVASRYDARMVVQNYIEGRDEEIYELHAYIDRDGELIGSFTGRKLRTYPIHRGIGCFVRSVVVPGVFDVGLRALRELGYTGHAAVQLKQLPGAERFEIFEINCRYSAWNYLHARAGVNLAYAAYRDSLGEKQRPLPSQREGIRWVDMAKDMQAFRDYRRLDEWRLGSWLRSYIGMNCYAFFDWADPVPGLVSPTRTVLRLAGFPLRWSRRRLAAAAR